MNRGIYAIIVIGESLSGEKNLVLILEIIRICGKNVILDRGPHPIQIILKLMEMPNVVCLTGNHELMVLECLEFLMQEITEISIEKVDEKMLENLVTWQHNGSKSTIDEFRALSREKT